MILRDPGKQQESSQNFSNYSKFPLFVTIQYKAYLKKGSISATSMSQESGCQKF